MISNGFDETEVLAVLRTRIGWIDPIDPSQPSIDDANTQSVSGRRYEDFHASVTIPFVFANQGYAKATPAEFNAYLSKLKDSVIMNALNIVFGDTQMVDPPQTMYGNRHRIDLQKETSKGRFVGQEITVSGGNYKVQIPRVGLLFDRNVTFPLYLYEYLKPEPVKTVEVSASANSHTFIDLEGWDFNGKDSDTFFFGYYQDDIGEAKALSVYPCRTPSMKVVGIKGMEANTGQDGPSFYPSDVSVTGRNYGLNLEIASYRDYTTDIIRGSHLFDELQGLQMAAQVIDGIVFSARANGTERITGENALMLYRDLNTAMPTDKEPFEPGLKNKLKKEAKRVRDTFFPRPSAISVNISGHGKNRYA